MVARLGSPLRSEYHRGMELRKCIYCLESKPSSEFNEEHVVPESIGTYKPTPKLTCVCEECNGRLGRKVVSPFLRRSLEGLLRYGFGQRELVMDAPERDRLARLDQNRIKFRPNLPPLLSGIKGLHLLGYDKPNHGLARSLPQIGLWPPGIGLPEWFTMVDLENPELDLSKFSCTGASQALALCEDDETANRLVVAARARGASVEFYRRVELPERFQGELSITLGPQELRFPPYVAFNVAAFYLGHETVMERCFDEVRGFIRGENELKALDVVGTTKDGPLFFDRDKSVAFGNHVVTIGWENQTRDLVANVSLFHVIHYKVYLIRNHRGLWRSDWQVGRIFDWRTGEIRELRPLPRHLIP